MGLHEMCRSEGVFMQLSVDQQIFGRKMGECAAEHGSGQALHAMHSQRLRECH